MSLDLDELEARIAEGERKNLLVAPVVKQLISELRELRAKIARFEQTSEKISEQKEEP